MDLCEVIKCRYPSAIQYGTNGVHVCWKHHEWHCEDHGPHANWSLIGKTKRRIVFEKPDPDELQHIETIEEPRVEQKPKRNQTAPSGPFRFLTHLNAGGKHKDG